MNPRDYGASYRDILHALSYEGFIGNPFEKRPIFFTDDGIPKDSSFFQKTRVNFGRPRDGYIDARSTPAGCVPVITSI